MPPESCCAAVVGDISRIKILAASCKDQGPKGENSRKRKSRRISVRIDVYVLGVEMLKRYNLLSGVVKITITAQIGVPYSDIDFVSNTFSFIMHYLFLHVRKEGDRM